MERAFFICNASQNKTVYLHNQNIISVDSGTIESDFLVIGSGLAGLYSALNAARHGTVTLVTKSGMDVSSSYWAQGGVAVVLNPDDSFESHIEDTVKAGRDYCSREAVEMLVKEGALCIEDLIGMGMQFDQSALGYDLGLEGGHSARRILHANGAATGKALIDFLLPMVMSHPRIEIIEHGLVHHLLCRDQVCGGADLYSLNEQQNIRVLAPATILATGGYCGLFSRTTNPGTSTGDGLWLAYSQGAVLKDMEFVQFHPTAFYSRNGSSFLISEALRGEGARLRNQKGEYFMERYPEGDLSPRDLVSREIFRQLRYQENPYVTLDLRHLPYGSIKNSFPRILERVEECGIDIRKEGIPVAPAAHYCIGGVETDLNGRTALKGLYACGETAATGVHGANRLASNSLLECLVFGSRAVKHASVRIKKRKNLRFNRKKLVLNPDNHDLFAALKAEVSSLLNRYMGIERDQTGLQIAMKSLAEAEEKLKNLPADEYYAVQIQGMLTVAAACFHGAVQRKESRGVHCRTDFPKTNSNKVSYHFVNKASSIRGIEIPNPLMHP